MAMVNFDKVRELIVKSGTVTIDSVEYIGIIDCSKIIGEHDLTYTGDFLIKPFNSGESKIINQNYNNLQNQIQNVVDAQVQEKMGENYEVMQAMSDILKTITPTEV